MSPDTDKNAQAKKIASWAFFLILIGAALGLMIWSFSGGRGDLAKSADSVDPKLAGVPLSRPAAKGLRNPYPETAAFRALGKKHYEKYCIRCHGSTGHGVVEHEFPNRLDDRTEGEYVWVLTYGIQDTAMLSFADRLKLKDRWALVRYVRGVLGGEDPENPGVSTISPDAEAAPGDGHDEAAEDAPPGSTADAPGATADANEEEE